MPIKCFWKTHENTVEWRKNTTKWNALLDNDEIEEEEEDVKVNNYESMHMKSIVGKKSDRMRFQQIINTEYTYFIAMGYDAIHSENTSTPSFPFRFKTIF